MQRFCFLISFLALNLSLFAQADSLRSLEEVVVTATRQERRMGNVAIPVQLIQKKQVLEAGSLRLRDILQEQTGLQLTSSFGTGVQLQGLNPEHTLILLDGQPLVGRTSGVLDLSRISLIGIKRIEIVKGPSSSLYGSEAMAGVINLISEPFKGPSIETSLRYGVADPDRGWGVPFSKSSFQQLDATVQTSFSVKKWNIIQSYNFLYTEGISFRPYSTDRIPRPIHRLTHQTAFQKQIGERGDFRLLFRFNQDQIKQEFSVRNNGLVIDSYGRELNQEFNIQPTYTHRFSNRLRLHSRGYFTRYSGDQQLRFIQKPDSLYLDRFEQRLIRIEEQLDLKKGNADFVIGAGLQWEQAWSTRYDALTNRKQNEVVYAFAQWEQPLFEKLISVIGFRYDDNRLFAGAFTPKWALRFNPSSKLSFHASVGQGFKAPDFRQLYLNFTNNAAGGYSVFGAQDALRVINQLQRNGQIAELKNDFYLLQSLQPEQSTGINLGVEWKGFQKMQTQFNVFRNDIESLIDVRQVATRVDGSQLFSYINVNRAFTQGAEINISLQPSSQWNLQWGYQWLQTGDKEEWQRVKKGLEYIRDASGASVVMSRIDYVGLPNRSKHQAQFKLRYQPAEGSFLYLRLIYRSRWTIANSNGNGVHDLQDEHAAGFVQANISGGVTLSSVLQLQAGIDNLFNYQDLHYMPNFQGRTVYLTLRHHINQQKNRK